MTIIAYRDGVVAADDLFWDMSADVICGRGQKLRLRKDGAILAGCGSVAAIQHFFKHALKGKPEKAKERADYQGSIFFPDGRIEEWDGSGLKCEYRADFYVSGSGSTIARGAMQGGLGAVEAVKAVCESFGWPADIHALNHEGKSQIIPVGLKIHDSARITELDLSSARSPRRSRARSNRRQTRQTRRGAHR